MLSHASKGHHHIVSMSCNSIINNYLKLDNDVIKRFVAIEMTLPISFGLSCVVSNFCYWH